MGTAMSYYAFSRRFTLPIDAQLKAIIALNHMIESGAQIVKEARSIMRQRWDQLDTILIGQCICVLSLEMHRRQTFFLLLRTTRQHRRIFGLRSAMVLTQTLLCDVLELAAHLVQITRSILALR